MDFVRDFKNYKEEFKNLFQNLRSIVLRDDPVKMLSEEGKDIKIGLDRTLNYHIIRFLNKVSDFPVLSEESETACEFNNMDGNYWIVDPLDGSFNRLRGIPLYCTSIALWNGCQPYMGFVFDYLREEYFFGYLSGESGCSYLNDRPIVPSGNTEEAKSVLATGFPSYRSFNRDSVLEFVDKIIRWKKLRLIGSAALSLVWVAVGRCDAYAEEDIKIWDVAAGLAILRAAGGRYLLKINEEKSNCVTVAATNGKISPEVLV